MRLLVISILTLITLASPDGLSQTGQFYGFEGGVVASKAVGKDASFYHTGLGIRAGAFYDLEPNIRLAFVLGLVRSKLDADAITKQYQIQGGRGTVEVDGGLTAFPILVSVRLISPPRGVRFYGDLELGIFTYWTKASGQIVETTGITPVPERSEFRSEPGGSLGLGFLFALGETLSLDAGVRYSFVNDSEYASYTGSTTTVSITTSQVLGFALGLSYALPI